MVQEQHGPSVMCNDKTDLNITCTLLFLDNISIFYQAFGMNLPTVS